MITSYSGDDATDALEAFLAARSLTPADFMVFEVLWDTPLPPAKLIRAATRASKCNPVTGQHGGAGKWRISRAEAENAVVGLVDCGFLRLIDSIRRSRIANRLAADGKLYFPDVVPSVGDVDVTDKGARMLMQMYRSVLAWNDRTECIVFDYPNDLTVHVLATSEEYLRQGISAVAVDHGGKLPRMTMIAQIKGWRDRWWRVRRHGVRAELKWSEAA